MSATPLPHFRPGIVFSPDIDQMLIDPDFENTHDTVEVAIFFDDLARFHPLHLHFAGVSGENLIGEPITLIAPIELMALISLPGVPPLCKVDVVAPTIRTESLLHI